MWNPKWSAHSDRKIRRALRMVTLATIGVLLMLTSGCVYFATRTPAGFCSQDLDAPIRNFCVVDPAVLWEGERPTVADVRWLLEHGVACVVSLELDDRATFDAIKLPAYLHGSVRYFRLRGFSPVQLLSRGHIDDRVALFLAITRRAPKPIYVHCRAGVDRTVVLAATYRVLVDGADPEKVVEEFGRLHSPWFPIESRYLRGLTPARRSMLLRKAAVWEQRIQPSGEIRCLQGRCVYQASAKAEEAITPSGTAKPSQ
jgi:hypothetical protein